MSTQSIPQIPPRPSRAQAQKPSSTNSGSTLGSGIPKVPPRPTNRRIERSVSPHRDSFARSPLNEPGFVAHKPASAGENGHISISDTPRRPSSVINMPSLGQEGIEYAEIFTPNPEDESTSPNQTRNVAEDLKLYAPTPALPRSSATERIGTVTRTDSSQAAAFGLGKARGEDRTPGDDKDPQNRPLKAKASFSSSISNGVDRPASTIDIEGQPDGPEVGQRVPMYPNAGLVQAPSSSPLPQYPPGVGFHNDGSKQRHHGRRTSARGFEGPPGSYGMHGHGVIPKDKFEQAYYEKHPELWKKETGAYGEDRKDWALSSEDLNKIVRQTASRGSGLGASPAVIGTPTEQIGYVASEEYISRMSSPRPASIVQHSKAPSNASDAPLQSHLRKESDTTDVAGSLGRSLQGASETALESEFEDEDVVHVEEPNRRISRISGGAKHADYTENLGPSGGNTSDAGGFIVESGYGVPILASDEVAKEPFGYELQPAISPQQDNTYDNEQLHYFRTGSASSQYGSKPSSRPGSIRDIPTIAYQGEFDKEARATPLEDVAEYEPLFPEDEKSQAQKQKPADKSKSRSETKGRKFPSQDVWEDAPDSHLQTATVSTPQLPEEREESNIMDNLNLRKGETPEAAFARYQEELADEEFRKKDSESFLKEGKQPWEKKETVAAKTGSGLKQRFPSRDIWEDTPDSLQLQATVSAPQTEELSVPEELPTTGAVAFLQEKQADVVALGDEEGRATTGIAVTAKPSIPARPATRLSDQKPDLKAEIPQADGSSSANISPVLKAKPAIPERAKPAIPARPAKKNSNNSVEGAPLTTVTSAGSARSIDSVEGVPLTSVTSAGSARSIGSVGSNQSAAAAKPKPPVPSRPIGSKIAALQGGFMSDLNKRLQLGPQAPKKEEPKQEEIVEEKEKAPLTDARKGRARGPARRSPPKAEAKPSEASPSPPQNLGFAITSTVWEISPDDDDIKLIPEDEAQKVTSKKTQPEPTKSDEKRKGSSASIASIGSTLLSAMEVVEESAATATKKVEELVGATETSGADEDDKIKANQDTGADVEPEAESPEKDLSASVATLKPSEVEAKTDLQEPDEEAKENLESIEKAVEKVEKEVEKVDEAEKGEEVAKLE